MRIKPIRWIRNMFRCLIPVRNRGTVGTIQITLVICVWVMAFFIAVSVILERVKRPDDNWLAFLEAFTIGSACSIVIVIVTTIIQFISNRNDKAKDFLIYITNLSTLMFAIMREGCSLSKESKEPFAEELKRTAKDYIRNFERLYWFDGEKDDLYRNLSGDVFSLCIHLISDPAYAYNLDMKETKRIILNSYQFVDIVKLNDWNALDSIAELINSGNELSD